MELGFADLGQLKADGRNFNCLDCPENVQRIRRCREDREDFTEADGNPWPMYVNQGGSLYGFCPAKATWDPRLAELFRLLVISAETGAMLNEGGLYAQPDWWVELLGWFLPQYDMVKFSMKAKMFVGSGKKTKDGAAKLQGSQPKPRRIGK